MVRHYNGMGSGKSLKLTLPFGTKDTSVFYFFEELEIEETQTFLVSGFRTIEDEDSSVGV